MCDRKRVRRFLFILGLLLVVPAVAHCQAVVQANADGSGISAASLGDSAGQKHP